MEHKDLDPAIPVATGGYDASFLCGDLDPRFRCPVCLAVLRDPVQTQCGHRFCKTCFNRSSQPLRFSRCPVDKSWIDTQRDVFSDTAIRREVMSLQVRCDHHTQGCQWTGELRSLQGHLSTCPEAQVSCRYLCGARCKRNVLEEHEVQCPHRPVSCQYCGGEVLAMNLTKHQLFVCIKFPVNCHVCGVSGILREDVPKHTDLDTGDCPLVTVKCALADIGCYFQDKRQNMSAHYHADSQRHLVLMMCRVEKLEEIVTSQSRSLKHLATDRDNFKTIASSLISRIQKLEEELLKKEV